MYACISFGKWYGSQALGNLFGEIQDAVPDDLTGAIIAIVMVSS
jgi:hypothetical protein